MAFESIICPVCGESFVPFPKHSLTDGQRHLVCSPHCSTAAHNKRKQKKEEAAKRAEERRRINDKKSKERRAELKKDIPKSEVNRQRKKIVARAVCVVTKDGEVIKRFPSIAAASRDTGYSEKEIPKICDGIRKCDYTYVFQWDNSEEAAKKPPAYSKEVYQYTLDGKFVAKYESAMEAAKAFGCCFSNISQCCKGVQKTACGFVFTYKEREDKNNEN